MTKATLNFILLFAFCSRLVDAQQNKWFFSHDLQVEFNGSFPPDVSSVVHHIENFTEWSAVVCDDDGELLFYTDGYSLWNRNHILMPNGVDLGGNKSSSQGVLIIQSERSSDIYHAITIDAFGDVNSNITNGNFYHSIIDMGLEGGSGNVTLVKKQLIDSGKTERMVGYPHPCGGVWIIIHERDNADFQAYRLSKDELSDPVTSSIGAIHDHRPDFSKYFGQMKISPDGSTLAVVGRGLLQFFRFDVFTGQVSSLIDLVDEDFFAVDNRYYSGAFSPSGQLFYLKSLKNNVMTGREVAVIEQIAMKPYQRDSIMASWTEVGVLQFPTYHKDVHLALGPDNRIYIANDYSYDALSTINKPDLPGVLCDFEDSSVPFPGRSRSSSIPTPLIKSVAPDFRLPGDTSLCEGDSIRVEVSDFGGGSIIWQDGSTAYDRTIKTEGTYSVVLLDSFGCEYKDTMTLDFVKSENVVDTILCPDEDLYLGARQITTSGVYYDTLIGRNCPQVIMYNVSAIPQDGDTITVELEEGGNFFWLGKKYDEAGVYEIKTEVSSNCNSRHYLHLKMGNINAAIYIPNAITPNGDGINDRFEIYGNSHEILEAQIYDRWGELIYTGAGRNVAWDGRVGTGYVSPGVYLYRILLENEQGSVEQKVGTVSVLR